MQSDKPERPQTERFIEAAREMGCEENFDRFEEALRKIAGSKPKKARDQQAADVEKGKAPKKGAKR